jgi:hypothetical protein
MKPILLATLEYPPQIGGVAEYLRHLVEQFPTGAVEILAASQGDTHASDMASDAVIFRRRLEWRIKPRWLPSVFWIWSTARLRRASFILVSHLIPMGTAARFACKILKLPYGVIVHGTDLVTVLNDGGLKRLEAARVLKGADLVISNGAYTNQLLAPFKLPAAKLMTVRPCPSLPLETVVGQVNADRPADSWRERISPPSSVLWPSCGTAGRTCV